MEKFALAFGPPSVSDTATGKGLSRASEDGGLQKLEAERSLSNRILPIAARRIGHFSTGQRLMIKGLALVLALSYCSTINAGIIFSNEVTGLAPENFNPFMDGQFVDAHVVVSGIGRGSGIAGTSGQDRYNARSWSTSSTIDLNDYFRFTIAPQAGFEMDYSDFIYTGQRSTSGPTTFSFRTSVASSATINLSSALFQNVTAPIEFRVYGYGASLASGTFSINDFSFNGAVSQISAIPEPPSAALGVLAMTAGLWHSRLRRLPLSTTTSAGE